MRGVLVFVAVLSLAGGCATVQRQSAPQAPSASIQWGSPPQELPTTWEAPPADPVENAAAGLAKVLCSACFVTGLDLEKTAAVDGLAISPLEQRQAVTAMVANTERKQVDVTLATGATRTARLYGDQGCVILPKGSDSVFFTPLRVSSTLPDAETEPWPMGDLLPGGPFPTEVDAVKVAQATAAAFDPPEALTAAFVVVYKGRIIAERYEQGSDHATRYPGWSMGKSLTATLMGQLIHEGAYELWAPAPVDEWREPGDPRAAIRVADLLRMSSGLRFEAGNSLGYPDHLYIYTGAIDAYKWAVTRPLQYPPNSVGRYRNCDPLILNLLIKRHVAVRGEEYLSYPQRHLFDKIGIQRMILETDPYGNFLLCGYELGTARDWVRLGMLYLNDGVWDGERLLPEGWTDFVRTPAPAWTEPKYGSLFWLNRTKQWPVPEDAYYMAGAGGQFTFVIPTHDLVVVRLGHDKGDDEGYPATARALALLMEAVPRVREPWSPQLMAR